MRIISGASRGRRLKPPDWTGLRPTSDKLRETLFNVVAPRVADARVLDLFAGTGALGLEALSRGAAQAVFIDHDRRAVALVAENAARCGVGERCVIIRATVERALEQASARGPFDLIFVDPPYEFDAVSTVTAAARALARGGLLVLEHTARRSAPQVDTARAVRTIRSGDSALTLFEAG
ncbi:MAG: 16S rRNA (guanine(966)-N(2))-methyltransferase RsmD [Acidobacteriota bacterium]